MGSRRDLRAFPVAAVGLVATLAFAGATWSQAAAHTAPAHKGAAREGEAKNGAAKEAHKGGRHGVLRPLRGSNYHPPYAAIVVDDNTDQAIYEANAPGYRRARRWSWPWRASC
jgi:hypothetical protein